MIYDSYVAYETAKELAEEREMKKEAKDIKVIFMKMMLGPRKYKSDENVQNSTIWSFEIPFLKYGDFSSEFIRFWLHSWISVAQLWNSDALSEQVKAVRKRLLETPKESGNEEVKLFIILQCKNVTSPLTRLTRRC